MADNHGDCWTNHSHPRKRPPTKGQCTRKDNLTTATNNEHSGWCKCIPTPPKDGSQNVEHPSNSRTAKSYLGIAHSSCQHFASSTHSLKNLLWEETQGQNEEQ